nr:hypothetical protein [Ectobacillus panaciterrae]
MNSRDNWRGLAVIVMKEYIIEEMQKWHQDLENEIQIMNEKEAELQRKVDILTAKVEIATEAAAKFAVNEDVDRFLEIRVQPLKKELEKAESDLKSTQKEYREPRNHIVALKSRIKRELNRYKMFQKGAE